MPPTKKSVALDDFLTAMGLPEGSTLDGVEITDDGVEVSYTHLEKESRVADDAGER